MKRIETWLMWGTLGLLVAAAVVGAWNAWQQLGSLPGVRVTYEPQVKWLIASRQYARAQQQLQLAAQLDFPNLSNIYRAEGEVARLAGDGEQRVAALRKLIETDVSPDSCVLLAMALLERGRDRQDLIEAVELAEVATRMAPQMAMAHYCLGFALLRLQEYQGAQQHLEVATRLDPGLAPSCRDLQRRYGPPPSQPTPPPSPGPSS